MARLLSNMVLRGTASSSNYTRMKFLTKGTGDSVVNEGLPTNGFASSGTHPTRITSDPDTQRLSVDKQKYWHLCTGYCAAGTFYLQFNDVQSNPVMIYTKGLPDAPRCGFSALAVKVLQQYGKVSLSGHEIFREI